MISAIISTYNREKYLPKLFKSICNQDYLNFEIIIINNNSPGNTKELTDEFIKDNPTLSIKYFLETQQGLSFGRNRGIKEAKGNLITFLDDDAIISSNYFNKIASYFNQYPTIIAIGSKILLDYESITPKWENPYLNSLLGYFNLGDTIKLFKKNNYPRGSNMSFRKEVFSLVGMFNTELGRIGSDLGGSEEKDIFQRIYNKQLKVLYVPDAIVYHAVPVGRTTYSFIKKQAIGTGKGEYLRVKKEGLFSLIQRILLELVKWIFSFALLFWYFSTFRVQKGWMIIRFRFWLSYGFIT
jgi:glucosyl-dolichyl phosphate glucuronosyltransferase